MNYQINNLPDRTEKPRNSGLTMVMDKGLSLRQVEDFIEVCGSYTDMVKLGWATSYVTPNLTEKLNIYREAGIPVYFGGTLFEAMIVRGQFDDYCRMLDKFKMDYAEVSDGSINLEHTEKCEYIQKLSKITTVISEVGSKDIQKIFAPYKWINLMRTEIEAGSWKVIAEARESGNVGIYRDSGEVRQGLVDEILTQIPAETIIWEAPQKAQQVWFIKLIGANVNLGNIAPADVVPVETLRLGIRSDTFDFFL
ncbi:MAG TPA: phosphosulfolactate synthase [Mucilaginibacter sp.]|nr:phosphosulfolactate synthase [Mucilaginibacter sp.]